MSKQLTVDETIDRMSAKELLVELRMRDFKLAKAYEKINRYESFFAELKGFLRLCRSDIPDD